MTFVPESVIPGLVALTKEVTTCEATTGAPFKVSLTNTFVKAVPPAKPFTEIPVSLTASITGICT